MRTLAVVLFLSAVNVLSSEPPPVHGICIASLNLDMQTNVATITKGLRSNDGLWNCDILLLQEVVRSAADEPSVANRLAESLGRHVAFASPTEGGTLSGLGIVSRYPLTDQQVIPLHANHLHFRSRSRIGLGVTVQTPDGPLRVFNTHLDTRINGRSRLEQLRPVVEAAEAFPGPRIVGGDLNTNAMTWLAHTVPLPYTQVQSSAVQKFMAKHGFQTPFSRTGPTSDYLRMRLDWIFASKLKSWNAGIKPMKFSDHHAIWARIVQSQF
jgi:endonuclease/exonuclease/phosphatase family metal-dependent hydrolase